MSQNSPASGVVNLFSGDDDFEIQSFVIKQALAKTRTSTIVKVLKCTNSGGLSPVGFVDIAILVQRMDGAGNAIDAGTIFNVPYFRMQGGTDAVIMDPKVGDIGIANIADRDISSVKASKAAATPGSVRRHDMADAIYIGGILNGTPTQYIQFTDSGITVLSPTKVTIHAPVVAVEGDMTVTGKVTAAGDVIGAGISLSTHHTQGVTPGSGISGLPI